MVSVKEALKRIEQGWTYAEARMGKDWESKYPNIASWQGGYSFSGSNDRWKISLAAACGSEFTGFHTTIYTLLEKEIAGFPDIDIYQFVDEAIAAWNREQGPEAILRFKKGWIGEAGWEACYPHLARWIAQGKRHCIRIDINLVTGDSKVKAWHYDKPSDTETVLFENDFENLSEQEVLQMLDEGIKAWMSEHEMP